MRNYFGVGIALGSTSGSVGNSIGCGDGVGVGNGVNTSPLFVVRTPPDIVTSSTKYKSPRLTTFFPSSDVDLR